MENKLVTILNKIEFSEKYINICNQFSDFDDGKNFAKKEILSILSTYGIDMKFSSNEKLFYKDYFLNNYSIRFLLGYKYGFIDCFYSISEKNAKILSESFREISLRQDSTFSDKVLYRFPIATNIEDFQDIIKRIWLLHTSFIAEFEKI